ncbi:MAG: multidrug efflux RND transporter permease subunit [Zavarzinella sp.]
MISTFFIDRPVFANVIAIFTGIFGLVALFRLPVERYPEITPPTVVVSASYPGADAQVIADTVAAPIEQEVNGVENMMYMTSTCSSDGGYSLTITFEIGTNLEEAQVQVQNRLAVAEPLLPEDVRRQGVSVKKRSANIIMAVALTSEDGTFSGLDLSNYAILRMRDELSRVDGVGDILIRGQGAYAMRVWLDPDAMAAKQITTNEVVAALRRQNVQVTAGQIGQPPTEADQQLQYSVTTKGRLTNAEEFQGIILKRGPEGQITYLRDVARVELGAQSYDSFSAKTGTPASNLLVYQLPGSNAMDVADRVKKRMEEISSTLPKGMEYSIPFDTTRFVRQAISEVYRTLIEAGILVLIVILVFLQSWRALLVPTTTVPVTIIGAFAFMPFLGFSINLLTLFGLILAIGIVVDEAIVIVENAAHHIERGKPAREATILAMQEVTGPVIAITLVLMAVFLPTAFLGGITGQLYRQFALTIAATAFISAVNALTLKPAQCATWLKPPPARRAWPIRAFNTGYGAIEAGYAWVIRQTVKVWWGFLLIFAGIAGMTGYWYTTLPTGFLPQEDQGYIIIAVQLRDNAPLQETAMVGDKMSAILKEFKEKGATENWFMLGGFSLLDGTNSPNAATMFVAWKDWSEREGNPALTQDAIVGQLRQRFAAIQEANILVLIPPSIQGIGVAGGFQMQVQLREGGELPDLQQRISDVIEAAKKRPEIGVAQSSFRSGVPQLYLDIDRIKCEKLIIPLDALFETLRANLGSVYVNDFNKFGRTYQVRVQAESAERSKADDIYKLYVRNLSNEMVPLKTLLKVQERPGPQSITRHNLYPAAAINGAGAPGISSGEALEVMKQVAAEQLPDSMGFEWTGIAYQEAAISGDEVYIFALAVLMVYLVLAAQYESWILPLAVILVVPLGLLGVIAAVSFRGLDNNIYTQIGVVLIIALASKNAILIVEFARKLRESGLSIRESAVTAARNRLRPILMTSFAFIMGVAPLVWSKGAGAASRQALGTAVFGGMLTATFLAIFFIPVFYAVMQWLSELRSGPKFVQHDSPPH